MVEISMIFGFVFAIAILSTQIYKKKKTMFGVLKIVNTVFTLQEWFFSYLYVQLFVLN